MPLCLTPQGTLPMDQLRASTQGKNLGEKSFISLLEKEDVVKLL